MDASLPPANPACATGNVDAFRDCMLSEGKPIEHVRALTTEVGARLAGSAGDAKAVAWAVARMKAIGLTNVRTDAVTVPHWERGMEHGELLGTTETPLAIAALGGSVATPATGIEAEVLTVASVDALNSVAADQVKGKIVFFNTVTERAKDVSGYSKAVSSRRSGASAAAKKGAVAAIVRSISPAISAYPHTGEMASATIPAAAISVADALVLEKAVAAGTTRVRLTLGCQKRANAQSANVIGEVVGTERPEEIVLLGAHLDSWDLGTGALDDGAGVAMVLEAARFLAHAKEGTLRTVRVVLYANEEFGVSGGSAYATAHKAELANHIMAIEADLGGDRVYGATFVAGSSAAAAIREMLMPLMPLGISAATAGGDYGADIGALARAGVPVAELPQDLTRYFDYHHAGNDTLDSVDPEALKQAAAAMGVFAYQFARSTADIGRALLSERVHEH